MTGAMATDAGLTAYHAIITVGGAKPGMKVGVIGHGGLGSIGTRVAESIDAFKDKKLELIVDYAGFGTTTAAAIETLAEFGTLVQVGMGRLEATINTYPIISIQLSIKGSKSGTKEDLEGLYELLKSGELNPPMNLITQAEIPGATDKLRAGGVVGRFIAMYK